MLSSDDSVKSPSAALRLTGKVLDVQKVRLRLSRLARLAYEAFYEAVGRIKVVIDLPVMMSTGRFSTWYKSHNSNPGGMRANTCSGFTLLEVMVSLAIIAIVFVSVLRLQGQTISMNESARFYAVAPFLAQQKMSEITAVPSAFSGSQSGDFTEETPGYSWKARVDDFPVTDPDGGTMDLSSAVVTVTQEGSGLKLILKEYLSEARKEAEQ